MRRQRDLLMPGSATAAQRTQNKLPSRRRMTWLATSSAGSPCPVPGSGQPGRVQAVEVLPMRQRDQVMGALNLLSAASGPLRPATLRIGQALATGDLAVR